MVILYWNFRCGTVKCVNQFNYGNLKAKVRIHWKKYECIMFVVDTVIGLILRKTLKTMDICYLETNSFNTIDCVFKLVQWMAMRSDKILISRVYPLKLYPQAVLSARKFHEYSLLYNFLGSFWVVLLHTFLCTMLSGSHISFKCAIL